MPFAITLLLLLVTVPLVIALVRANELFLLRIHDGQVRVSRGRVPPRLLQEIGDVVRDPMVARGTLRGVSEDGRVRLYPDAPLSEAQKQQLRNVIAQWPVAKVRNAPRRR